VNRARPEAEVEGAPRLQLLDEGLEAIADEQLGELVGLVERERQEPA